MLASENFARCWELIVTECGLMVACFACRLHPFVVFHLSATRQKLDRTLSTPHTCSIDLISAFIKEWKPQEEEEEEDCVLWRMLGTRQRVDTEKEYYLKKRKLMYCQRHRTTDTNEKRGQGSGQVSLTFLDAFISFKKVSFFILDWKETSANFTHQHRRVVSCVSSSFLLLLFFIVEIWATTWERDRKMFKRKKTIVVALRTFQVGATQAIERRVVCFFGMIISSWAHGSLLEWFVYDNWWIWRKFPSQLLWPKYNDTKQCQLLSNRSNVVYWLERRRRRRHALYEKTLMQ